jgi:uracil-DNA glycosylase
MSDGLRDQVARLVRQSIDRGETEWFLDRHGRDELLRSVRAGQSPAASGMPFGVVERPTSPDAGVRSTAPSPAPAPPTAPPARKTSQSLKDALTADVPAAEAPTRPKTLPVLPDDHDALRDVATGCTRCGLSKGRTQVVFSDGAPNARLMVVGEAPGANEDETGLPFVGAAGKFLDLLLASVDLSREESVYICNVLKCRPPGNRNPEPSEIETCAPFLLKQIEVVAPRAILAVGSFSGQLLTGQEKTALGKLRGRVHSYHGVPLVVTYHPAALLRNGNWTRAFWDDLQLLRDVLDEASPQGVDVP